MPRKIFQNNNYLEFTFKEDFEVSLSVLLRFRTNIATRSSPTNSNTMSEYSAALLPASKFSFAGQFVSGNQPAEKSACVQTTVRLQFTSGDKFARNYRGLKTWLILYTSKSKKFAQIEDMQTTFSTTLDNWPVARYEFKKTKPKTWKHDIQFQ